MFSQVSSVEGPLFPVEVAAQSLMLQEAFAYRQVSEECVRNRQGCYQRHVMRMLLLLLSL